MYPIGRRVSKVINLNHVLLRLSQGAQLQCESVFPRRIRARRMSDPSDDLERLLKRVTANDAAAVGLLFNKYHDRLRRMIRLRLDHRLQGRLDPSDVLQEAFLEYARALPEYVKNPEAPFYLWLRCITGRKLRALHRKHLG